MVTTTNLVSYWKLDEASGNAEDSHGSNDGTVSGCTYGETGILNDAYSFDGNDYIDMPSSNTIFGANPDEWSVNLWIKTSTTADDHIWSAYENVKHPGLIRIDASADIVVDIYDGSTNTQLKKAGTYNDNAWHMLTMTVDKNADSIHLYVDGVDEDDDTLPSITDYTNDDNIQIGRYPFSGGGGYYEGIVDEISAWDKTLTSSDVSDLYNSGAGLAYPFSTGTNMQINIGDAWKDIDAMQINIGDAWKSVDGVQINIGDAWKSVF